MKREAQRTSAAILLLLGVAATAFRLGAGVVKITLPTETASLKIAPGSGAAIGQCLTCHSAEYITTQPPLSLKAWTAEVTKMKEKYGAPIPGDQIGPLAGYLAVNYGTETNLLIATPGKAQGAAAADVTTFATMFGCLSCHRLDTKLVGPAYNDVRAKYLHDPDAIEKICRQIHNGGSGKWGLGVPMPAFPMISDAEAKKLAVWIMSTNRPAASGAAGGNRSLPAAPMNQFQ